MKTEVRKILDNLCDELLSRCAEVMLRRCPECGKDYAVRDLNNLKGYDLKKELILDEAEIKLDAIGRVWIDEFETRKSSQPSIETPLHPSEVETVLPPQTVTISPETRTISPETSTITPELT